MPFGGFGTAPYGLGSYGSVGVQYETFLELQFAIETDAVSVETECTLSLGQKLLNRLNAPVFRRNINEDSNLNTIIKTWAKHLCELISDITVALKMLSIITARGFWLDLWGSYFSVQRFNQESDYYYRARILAAMNNPKCTREAILKRIRPYVLEDPSMSELIYDGIPGSSFPANGVVDYNRRRARIVITLKEIEPSDRFFFLDYSYLGRESYEPLLEERETYITESNKVSAFPDGFEAIKKIVNDTKMAGIKVFYKTSTGDYIR